MKFIDFQQYINNKNRDKKYQINEINTSYFQCESLEQQVYNFIKTYQILEQKMNLSSLQKKNFIGDCDDEEVETINQPDWKYDDDPYQASAISVSVVNQAFQKKKDLRFIQNNAHPLNITTKSEALYRYTNNVDFDRNFLSINQGNKSGQTIIYERWPFENDKYVEYDCESDNSEDDEIQFDFPECDDIMAIIETERQDGKMYFVAKIIAPQNKEFRIEVQRIKGGGNDPVVVEILEKKDVYYLFKISFTSQVKVFKIRLLLDQQVILESKPFNFTVERIEYSLGIAYDFVKNRKLAMSVFEGAIAASSFNLVDAIDFFEKSLAKFEEKSKSYLNEEIEVDGTFENFLNNQKNLEKWLLQFQLILKSPQNIEEKVLFYKKPIVQKIANYFMKFMVKHDLKINEEKRITLNVAQKLIESYLEIFSIEKIRKENMNLLKNIDSDELNKKVGECLEFLTQQKKFDLVYEFITLEIEYSLNVAHKFKGLDSFIGMIEDSVEAFDETYVDLVALFMFYFVKFTKMTPSKLINILKKSFSEKIFQWNNGKNDQQPRLEFKEHENMTIKYLNDIAANISIENQFEFQTLFQLVQNTKTHSYLKPLFGNVKLLEVIEKYSETLIKQVQKIKEPSKLKQAVQILVDYCFNSLQTRINKLKVLNDKVLKSSIPSKDYQAQCQISHKLILNPLLKNFKNQSIETIKNIEKDISNLAAKKMSFNLMSSLIDKCFEMSIISAPGTQQIYRKFLLDQMYKQYFKKDNADDFENQKGDLKNWPNEFKYQYFVSSYILENVVKILFEKNKKQLRKREKVVGMLKDLVDKGACSSQQKQNLKYIIEMDNIELSEQFILKVISEQRQKLFVLKKLQADANQQIILQSFTFSLTRKFENQQMPWNIYTKIQRATQAEKTKIQSIFGDCEIIKIVAEKHDLMISCFDKLSKVRSFIEILNRKYKLSDYTRLMEGLRQSQTNTKQKELRDKDEIIQIINMVDDKILKCYSFRSFFAGQQVQNISFEKAIERCKELQIRLIQYRDRIVQQFHQNQLTYGSVDFFKEELSREKQLQELFLIDMREDGTNENNGEMLRELLKTFTLIKKVPLLIKLITGLIHFIKIDQTGRLTGLLVKLGQISDYLKSISADNPDTNISKLSEKYNELNKIIESFKFNKNDKLSLEDKKSFETMALLEFFSEISQVEKQSIDMILSFKPEIRNLKEKCQEDEENFSVDLDDLQNAQTMINYLENIYIQNCTSFRILIQHTAKMMVECQRLKHSCRAFKKMNELNYEFMNAHKGDAKTVQKIYQIMKNCDVDLQFDSGNNLKISLIVQCSKTAGKKMQENQYKQFFEEEIKILKNFAVLYRIQNNENQKSEEQMVKLKVFEEFLGLLENVKQIKQIWILLREWGYIVFRKQNKTTLDQRIRIIKGDCNELNSYLKKYKQIYDKWVYEMKELQKISPKATLIQGENVRQFYEVLTNRNEKKKILFLNICEYQLLNNYIRKQCIKYKQDPEYALQVIKDFFETFKRFNKKEIQRLPDWEESYIKSVIMSEKKNDFIKGIMQIDPTRIKNLDMTKILICVEDTTTLDIKTLIEAAIQDETSEYVIIRPQKLSNKNQEFIIKKIEQHKKLNDKMSLKLCLVTNSETEALYQYFKSNFIKKNLTTNKEVQQIEYRKFLLDKSKNLQIIKSVCPGYGKTSYIIEQSKKSNRECIFFPITGGPSSEYIYNRFEQACQTIYKTYVQRNTHSSLVIQLHNIDASKYQIVNTCLQELITGRCIRYNGHFPQILNQTMIYIELENIQSIDNYNPLITFTFLAELLQINDNLVYEINERPKINFKLSDEKEMEYIIQHLDYFDKNILDKNTIPPYKEFKPKGIDEEKANILMNKYFFDVMPTSTYYQYQYFCKLVFASCKTFSSSYGLQIKTVKDLGLPALRGEFFKVLLKNCGQFIGRQIQYEEFKYQNASETQKKLKQIPFLIIPNTDGESFSFIFKDHNNVPLAVQQFYSSQEYELAPYVRSKNLGQIFGKHSIKNLEKANPKKFDQKIEQILCNISGSRDYSIQKDPNYVVNIDNFFKICLITLRQRQNIPITIMGEAGTGKTAILKHVSEKLYGHKFMTFNVNAGTKVEDIRKFLNEVKQAHQQLNGTKKIWVFFDEFNTLKEVGYMKQIIIQKRFEGKQLQFLKDIVIMGACNPFRKLKLKDKNQAEVSMIKYKQKQQKNEQEALAFHVLPPPHSMIESMWNFGALSSYEYEKYVSKMILNVDYKKADVTKLLLIIHEYLAEQFDSSFVSLRDIERFRTIYDFFNTKLPLNPHKNTAIYPGYENREERALIMSLIFCYTLRIESIEIKKQLYSKIESGLNIHKGTVEKVKKVQEIDFYHRLIIDYGSIAANAAIKENTYCFFVAIYNKLPMIIVGPPGCSKSLAIRILLENMKGYNSEDPYLRGFQSVRTINFQGSELCTSKQVERLFLKANAPSKKELDGNQSSIRVIVFDEIGLADKSKQNPLKVIHPYLEVGHELNLNNKALTERNYAFLGISNTNLDISKMSRMLVLRRPQPTDEELKDTALGIGASFEYGKNEKIKILIRHISEAFFEFLQEWHKQKNFRNFFSLRDFYSLIKYFLKQCQIKQININEDDKIASLLQQAIFKNLNGGNDSVELFMQCFCSVTQKGYNKGDYFKDFNIIGNMISCLEQQNLRFPLVIVQDKQSLSYLVNLLINKFKKTNYFEKSPFINDEGNVDYIIQSTASIIKTVGNGEKLILNNIEPTIQTSLYDMLNKFYIVRGEHNYCKISDVESGMTKNTLVHKDFNCIFFLLSENLIDVEAPFLSRFQKYSFGMEKISNFSIVQSLAKQIGIFQKNILEVCKSKNMMHYKIENFFQNCDKDSLKTLILRVINELNVPIPIERSQQAAQYKKRVMDEVIFQMVMNSTQDFIMLYQYVLERQVQLAVYSESIKKAVEKKKTFKVQEASQTILFTTDKNIIYETSGMENKESIKKLNLQLLKKQKDFNQSIRTFLNSQSEKIIFIQLYASNLDSIQYLISEVQKIKKQQKASKNQTYADKKIIFFFELNRQQKKDHQDSQLKGISYLCQYRQIFYQGKLEIQNIKYDRTQFFNNILDLSTVLTHVQEFFTVQIKSKDDSNNGLLLKKFKSLYNEVKKDKTNVLHRHLEEFIEKTEGININVNEATITEILSNPESFKHSKNFKEALTRQISNKSYYGVVSFFLKHLFEIDSFLTYSTIEIHQLNQVESLMLKEKTKSFIEMVKRSQVYENNLKLLVTKKIDFLKNEYKKMKMIKRLPSAQRKFTAEIGKGRFIHFSKFENEMILSKQVGSLSLSALDIFSRYDKDKTGNFEKELKVFRQQLHKKSSLVIKGEGQNKGENLYDLINRDNTMKELFILQLIIDMSEKKGINLQHIQVYMRIFKNLVSLESLNQQKILDLEYIIFILLALEQHLTFIFKLFSVLYDRELYLATKDQFFQRNRIRDVKGINPNVCSSFFQTLIREELAPHLQKFQSIKTFGGANRYFDIFTNCMLQIENLEKILKLEKPISPILISIRDISRFVSEFSEEHKYELLEEFVNKLSQEKTKPNIYSLTFSFVEKLYGESQRPQEKQMILKFQANKIFLQWFKDRPDDKDCLGNFIKKCDSDKTFCQNSMHVINYLLSASEIQYDNMQAMQEELRKSQNQLNEIAKVSKSNGFQNNLCILMVNIFLQKLTKENSGKSHPQIVNENKRYLINIYNRLAINDIPSPLYQIFLYAFTKFVVISYAQTFMSNEVDNEISALLDKDSDLSTNLRLFCLKIFRKYLTPREIKDRFIMIKKMHWAPKIEKDFEQDKSRSLIVPKDFCNIELTNIFNEIQKSDGSSFNLFQQMLEYSKGLENRYSILNFFMRYYYTYSYNDKVYKVKTIQHFQSIRAKFEEKLGTIETELISRYLKNTISRHYKSNDANSVNEEDLIQLNFFNLFLASKKSVSPLHSLFIENGELSNNIQALTKQQFSLSGPQNPFIANAANTINLSRNNNIGVYLCCNDCDYIYTHEDCGWPNQQYPCPMCGQKIGRKDKSHSLARDDKGARRIMHSTFVDKGSYFYVWNMKELQQYWQVQRKYIEAEINRMKHKKSYTIHLKKETVDITGLRMVDSGRISSFSFNILSNLIESISYFLISLNIIKPNQVKNMFGDNTPQIALNRLHQSITQTNNRIKSSLNLGNKFYGWSFGIQRNFIQDMNDFPTQFGEYQKSQIEEMEKLKTKLNIKIAEKKLRSEYSNLYIEFVKTIDSGFFIKDILTIKDYTAANQFTRDYAQKLFEKLVSLNTDATKFDFSAKYQTLQGKMQFPFDVFLTEDKIDEKKYNYYKIFKLPDQEIAYHEIVVKYESLIKNKYPFLDYILKQSELFIQMKNFYNVISYVNELHKEVGNRYERIKAETPLIEFIEELKDAKGNNLEKKLRYPQTMIQSWKKLSGFLGVLQNQCKVIGKMNSDYNEKTQLKAFLLDQSTKENVYGLMIASIFHNFAKMHNESMAVLNSRKNQIKAYSSLNLFNDLQKIHPQKIELQQIYILDEEQLKRSLEQCSVASITYGQNYIYHNFDAYEEYFLKKLEGKCEIISSLKQFMSICYNGEAFSAQTEGSAVLSEIREILDQKLSRESLERVAKFVKNEKSSGNFEKSVIEVRGDLEKIMLTLNSLKGNYLKEKSISQIINEMQIGVSSQELKNGKISEIPVCQVVDLYEHLQDQLMYNVIKRLPEKYKQKFDKQTAEQVEHFLQSLPRQQNDEKPTIMQFESAIMKFTSRTLQNGIFDDSKLLVEFVTSRADFWPKGYPDQKTQALTYVPSMMKIKICHIMALIELIKKVNPRN